MKLSATFIGIIFAILANFSFSILDTISKTAVVYHSIIQILLIKYCFILILSVIESIRKNNKFFYKTTNLKLQIIRSILSMFEAGCFVLSFRYLTLADTHSVAALAPVMVVALSAIFLKESVNIRTWSAIFVGFIGVLIIMRPGFTIFDPKSFIPFAAAIFLSLYQITTKIASTNDSNETSLFYTSIFGIFTMSSLAILYWTPMLHFSYFLFLGIGLFFSLGIYFQIIALSYANASIIQPYHYTLILWAIILGYIFYDDLPDIPTIIGATIITISGIYVLKTITSNK